METLKLDAVIGGYRDTRGSLLPVLEAVRAAYGMLNIELQQAVAARLGLPLSRVAGAVGFYSALNPELMGEGSADFTVNAPHPDETRLLLRTATAADPASAEEYAAAGGYDALKTVRAAPERIIGLIGDAGLRGRGGAGFPVGAKWRLVRDTPADEKYVICNASEGELGTYKDMRLLERAPHLILEGMAVCAAAVDASRGFIYLRGDYTGALEILRQAIGDAERAGYIGGDSGLTVELRAGAGAYVCGEETGILESIEGNRGEPRLKPPFPGARGLWGKPTVINNVETFANVPVIVRLGADGYRRYGTERCPGTKLYTLGGAVKNPGVYEFPMGTPMRYLYKTVGGGSPDGRELKAIQVGGGASGAIAGPDALDTALDIEGCAAAGMALGTGSLWFSGGDVVELAKERMEFFADQSCGACAPCRLGLPKLVELIGSLRNGDLDSLKEIKTLAEHVAANSRCGLGQAAPVPLLSALRNFRNEFEAFAGKGGNSDG